MYDIIHNIALYWKNKKRDVRPYANFDEYFLSPSSSHDYYNHIHIFYDKKNFKPAYVIKIQGNHVENGFFSKKYSSKQWSEKLFKKLIKKMKQIYNVSNKSIKNKSIKNKSIKNKSIRNKSIKNKSIK